MARPVEKKWRVHVSPLACTCIATLRAVRTFGKRQLHAKRGRTANPATGVGGDQTQTRGRPAISKMKKKPIDLGAGLVLQLPLAVGTLQWGTTWVDDAIINSKGCISEAEAEAIVSHFRQQGVSLFDTAEGYGGGTSEKRLGRCIMESDDASGGKLPQALQMTKFLPVPWRFGHASFEHALRESNKRMNIDCCPIYLLHSPVHWRPIEYWVESAAMCKKKGILNALGLSNCNADQCRRAFEAGQKFGFQ